MDGTTKIKALLDKYPWLKEAVTTEVVKDGGEKFKPLLKLMDMPGAGALLNKMTIDDLAKKARLEPQILIAKLQKLIDAHRS